MKRNRFFTNLNYTLANEDTYLERSVLSTLDAKKVFTVCGSGARSLSLLKDSVREMSIVDLSQDQLDLARLREACIRSFDYEEFILFMGYPPYGPTMERSKRQGLFNALDLPKNLKNKFRAIFETINWDSILYKGSWEKTFVFFSKITQLFLGKKNIDKLFNTQCINEQKKIYDREFPKLRWAILIFLLGNKKVFNALLYKGDFVKKNVSQSYYTYYKSAFDRIIQTQLVKKSFFMNLCFLGLVKYSDANPPEARKEIFERLKKNLSKCQLNYIKADIIDELQKNKDIDFISLSNISSYLNGEKEKNFLQLISKSLSKNGHIVMRNYLRTPRASRDGLIDITANFDEQIKKEQVQMYIIEVLKHE